MPRLCIVPRWAGSPETDFYPWLCAQPAVTERFDALLRPNVEDPAAPTIEAWVSSLRAAVGPQGAGDTYFLGHSVGCQAVLRFLDGLDGLAGDDVSPGVLCVAGWWDVDEPWDTIRPWIEAPLDHARARARAERISVLLSDNDPFTADWRQNERLWRDRLGADVTLVEGAAHFNGAQEPAVLEALVALVDASPSA